MSSFSCLSCRVSFVDSDLQRSHYKSNWHRYNLKRKVANLPPVTKELFDEKLTQQRNEAEDKKKDTSKFCNVCNKSFSNANAYENHMNSKKHKIIEGKCEKHVDGGSGGEKTATGGGEATKKTVNNQVKEQAMAEKTKSIKEPGDDMKIDDDLAKDDEDDDDEWEDVDDEDDDEDISEEEETEAIPPSTCLFCPHESVSLEQNLHHMTKSHSFFIPDIDYISELENFIIYLGAKVGDGKICLYCNKKSHTFQTIDAVQKHMRDKGHCMVEFEGDSALEYSDFYDFSSSYADFDPESDDVDDDTEVQTGNLEVDSDTMELVLPSGSRVGHRAFKHFYKQSLPPAHLQHKQERAMIKGLNVTYKSLGWHGTVSEPTRKTMSALRLNRQKGQEKGLKLGMKANKMQPHFRAQVRF